jgi:hypothetical protein
MNICYVKNVLMMEEGIESTEKESNNVKATSNDLVQVREMIRNLFPNSDYGFLCGDFPTFDISEILIGKCLGSGGFSSVAEIQNIRCGENMHCRALQTSDNMAIDNHESRALIAKHCVRKSGDARYAIKRLRDAIVKNDRDRMLGITDLVIETRVESTHAKMETAFQELESNCKLQIPTK